MFWQSLVLNLKFSWVLWHFCWTEMQYITLDTSYLYLLQMPGPCKAQNLDRRANTSLFQEKWLWWRWASGKILSSYTSWPLSTMLICNYFLRLWYKGLTFESNVTFRETLSASPLLWNFCDQKAGELTKYLSHRPVRESYTKLLICADLVTNLLARKNLSN